MSWLDKISLDKARVFTIFTLPNNAGQIPSLHTFTTFFKAVSFSSKFFFASTGVIAELKAQNECLF